MRCKGPLFVKHFPDHWNRKTWRSFVAEIERLVEHSYQPRLILDFTNTTVVGQDAIDLILRCVEQIERADGRVSVAGASPEIELILELTRMTSVIDMLPSVPVTSDGEFIPRIPTQDGLHNLAA